MLYHVKTSTLIFGGKFNLISNNNTFTKTNEKIKRIFKHKINNYLYNIISRETISNRLVYNLKLLAPKLKYQVNSHKIKLKCISNKEKYQHNRIKVIMSIINSTVRRLFKFQLAN